MYAGQLHDANMSASQHNNKKRKYKVPHSLFIPQDMTSNIDAQSVEILTVQLLVKIFAKYIAKSTNELWYFIKIYSGYSDAVTMICNA